MSYFDDHIASILEALDGGNPLYARSELNSLAAKAEVEITIYRREAVEGEWEIKGEIGWGEVDTVHIDCGLLWITLYLEGGEVVRGEEENSRGEVTEWAYGWGW